MAQNERTFTVSIVARDERTGARLVRGDLAGTGGAIVLRIDRESWPRVAGTAAPFANLQAEPTERAR